MSPKHFNNQSVVISGASSGIGLELAKQLVNLGAKVTLLARRLERLEAFKNSLKAFKENILIVKADVTSDEACERALQETIKHFGKINLIIANAGFGVSGNFSDLSIEDIRRQLETNLYGVLRLSKYGEAYLKKTKGQLVIIGSVAAFANSPGVGAYNISKAAVMAFANTLHAEWAVKGINVLLISPGFITSEIRLLDEKGTYQEKNVDPIPNWLVMPVEKAVKQMLKAIKNRRAHLVVTFHGKVALWLSRLTPWLLRYVFVKQAEKPVKLTN